MNLFWLFNKWIESYKRKLGIFDSLIFFPDIPKATISTASKVYLGSTTQISSKVSSTLPLSKYKWQKGFDGNEFQCIGINEGKFYETDGLQNPFLFIPNTTSDDILYYRLLVTNIIGGCVSNTVFLNVIGSMFIHVM